MTHWEVLLEASPDGILLLDSEGRITFANAVSLRLLGCSRELVGRRPIEGIPVIEIHQLVEIALSGATEGERECIAGDFDLRVRMRRVDEQTILLTIHDETQFHVAVRARTDFVANVSHELRTPMTAIMGYSETLLQDRDRLPEDLTPIVDTIYRNSRRLRDLFEDLLELHRIETRRRELPLELRPLRPLLEEACTLAADQASQRSQKFQLICEQSLRGWVNAEALQAVVNNLAQNASAYTAADGQITVAAKRDAGGQIIVTVADNGIGIAPLHQQRIFERFYRVDRGRSRRHGGTGLGLAIVKHLAQASRCTIDLDSEVGRGSTFIVRLPTNAHVG